MNLSAVREFKTRSIIRAGKDPKMTVTLFVMSLLNEKKGYEYVKLKP
jgi:hypothetical protein